MANVLAHKVVPSGDHDMPLSAVAHALQDLPHAQSNGGLTRAGGTREAHVQGRHSRVEAELAAHLHGRTDHDAENKYICQRHGVQLASWCCAPLHEKHVKLSR